MSAVSKRILIVDDDIEMASLMGEILKQRNAYEIFMAHDGIQAIEKSKQNAVDLILLDIRMPFFSGFWFCDAFKQREQTKNIPIIVVSALLDEHNVRKAYDAGAAAHLKKPFQPEELTGLVEKILN